MVWVIKALLRGKWTLSLINLLLLFEALVINAWLWFSLVLIVMGFVAKVRPPTGAIGTFSNKLVLILRVFQIIVLHATLKLGRSTTTGFVEGCWLTVIVLLVVSRVNILYQLRKSDFRFGRAFGSSHQGLASLLLKGILSLIVFWVVFAAKELYT